MALADLLEISVNKQKLSPTLEKILDIEKTGKKIGISPERIEPLKPHLRQYFAFWREYPDLFVDFMQRGQDYEKKTAFNLLFYQRV